MESPKTGCRKWIGHLTNFEHKMGQKKSEADASTEGVPWLTSCRLTLSLLGLCGSVSLAMMRANMSVAIVCMTDGSNTAPDDGNTSTPSSYFGDTRMMSPALYQGSKKGEFNWDRQLRGWVLSSIYIGYILTQVPGGWLANKYGAKIIIGVGAVSLTVLTLLTPVAARASVYILMVLQALKGVASGVYYPAFFQLLGRWAPRNERSTLAAIFSSGTPMGSVLSSILSGLLCDYGFDGGWPSIFYVFGMIGAVFCLAWFLMAFSSPAEHPRISDAELKYIQRELPAKSEDKSLHVPWKELLTCVPFYACLVVDTCSGWVWFVALTSLPQFMEDVLNFDIKQNGLYTAIPYFVNFLVIILGSILADCIVKKNVLGITKIRKIFQSLGMVPSAAMAVGVAFLPADQTAVVVVLLSLWVGLNGFTKSGSYVNKIEMAPRFSGVVMGINNMVSTLPGIIAPPIVGAMTKTGSAAEWQKVFFLCAGINLFGWLVYMLFADATLQSWAKDEPELDCSEGEAESQTHDRTHKEYPRDNSAFVDNDVWMSPVSKNMGNTGGSLGQTTQF